MTDRRVVIRRNVSAILVEELSERNAIASLMRLQSGGLALGEGGFLAGESLDDTAVRSHTNDTAVCGSEPFNS